MTFADTMVAISDAVKAAEIDGVGARCFGWPVGEVPAPCFIVGYPEGEMDLNLACGSADEDEDSGSPLVRMKVPAWYVVGAGLSWTVPVNLAKTMRDIKRAIDGDLDGAVDTALVLTAAIQPLNVSGVEYLAVRFLIDVVS